MDIAFRVDASLQIGTGHVMRCLTLADELSRHGHQCQFICREHEGHLGDLIASKGYELNLLPVSRSDGQLPYDLKDTHADWLGVPWQLDADHTLQVLSSLKLEADWLVIDHYALDYRYEKQVRPYVSRIMVIDDLADRAHDCDLLLDQNLGRNEADYQDLVPDYCFLLISPRYALLRPEFSEWRAYSLKRRTTPQLKRLLITMGGVDKDNATSLVLETLKGFQLPEDCRIDVVMGAKAPWLGKVREITTQMPWLTEVSVNVEDMAQRMADADLAIGAAGSTAWERCCLGLPAILVVLADNQMSGTKALEAIGAAVTIADPESIREGLPPALIKVSLPETLQRMSHAAAEVTDGKGASIIVTTMMAMTGRSQ